MTDAPLIANPPKPRLTLRVGVTGKRALAENKTKEIRKSLSAVLDALADFLITRRSQHQNLFSGEVPLLRVTCGMAEGTDQIAAALANARFDAETSGEGRRIETRLAAILPFAQEEFEKDFDNDPNLPKGQRTPQQAREAVAYFRELLAHRALEAKLEIADEAVIDSGNPEDRDQAYANLRDVLIEHTDVLIAVSDDVFGGSGGTVDVVRMAVQQGIPVVKIAVADAGIHMMGAAEADDPDQEPKQADAVVRGEPLPAELARQIERALVPQEHHRAEQDGAHDDHTRHVTQRLEHYFGESFEAARRPWLFQAVRDALTEWPRPPAREAGLVAYLRALAARVPRGYRALRVAIAKFFATKKGFAIETPEKKFGGLKTEWSQPKTVIPQEPRFGDILAKRHVWADALAVLYASRTRSSYIAIAFFGAMAVLIGLLSVFFHADMWTPLKIVILLAEAALLGWTGHRFFIPAHDHSWHERMVEYRVLAELLRHQRYVYAFGGAERLDHLVAQRGGDAWVGWYVRATLRELGFPTARLDATYRTEAVNAFRREELKPQLDYNEKLAKRFDLIDDRLAWFVHRSWRAIIAIALFGALVLGLLYMKSDTSPFAKGLLHALKPLLTIFMAFAPAALAAVHGVRFQMEFRNTAERAAATERSLRLLDGELDAYLARGKPPGRKRCIYFVREANEAMESDVSGWATVYKSKAAEPPG